MLVLGGRSIQKRKVQGIWSSRWTFFAAAVALVAGLGDFWATPEHIAAQGGGVYLACYVAALAFVAMPVAVAQLRVALRARANPIHAVDQFAELAGVSRHWPLMSQLATVTAMLLVARLAVVAGWLAAYAARMSSPEMDAASLDTIAKSFGDLLADVPEQHYWSHLFLFAVAVFSSMTVVRGMAKLLRVVLPLLLLVLMVLVYYAAELGDFSAARALMFEPRWADFDARAAFSALQQAFFTLSVGSFALMAYGAYFPSGRSVGRQVSALVILDLVVMLLGGLLVLALVVDQHIIAAEGPALLFISLPYTFGNLVFGDIAGTVFFTVLAVFALTSAVALLEPLVAYLVERWGLPRWLVAPVAVVVVAALTDLSIVSMQADTPLHFAGRSLHEWLDILTAQILLPFCALCFALFAGWRVPRVVYGIRERRVDRICFWLWQLLLRYIAPPALLLVLVVGVYTRLQ